MKKMRNLAHSEWRLSVMSLATLIGIFVSILIFLRELNQTFVISCLAVYALVVVSNAIYVFYKRK